MYIELVDFFKARLLQRTFAEGSLQELGEKIWEKNWNKPGGLFTSFRWLWSGCLVRGLGGQGQGMSATAHGRQKGFGRVDMASASLRIVAAILEGEPKRDAATSRHMP